MSWEDSQIVFAEEKIPLNVSLRPLPLPTCMLHSETDNQFKMC